MSTLAFTVEGKPITQGSMTAVYNRRTGRASIRHVQTLPLMKWRRAIKEAAIAAGAQTTGLPVAVSVVFGMPRPRSHYGRNGHLLPRYFDALPMYRDIDKMTRAVLDALTGVAYDDDRQVVDLRAIRIFGHWTLIEVSHVTWQDAARLATSAEASIGARQLPMSLLWEAGE